MNTTLTSLALCALTAGCAAETQTNSIEGIRERLATSQVEVDVTDAQIACFLDLWRPEAIAPLLVCDAETRADESRSDDECLYADTHGLTVSPRAQAFAAECYQRGETCTLLSDLDGCDRYSQLLTDDGIAQAEGCLDLPCEEFEACYLDLAFCSDP